MSGYCVISSELLLDAGHFAASSTDGAARRHAPAVARAPDRDDGESYEPELFPRINSHDLRRSFGTWLRADGVPVSEVAAMLGHADSRMQSACTRGCLPIFFGISSPSSASRLPDRAFRRPARWRR